MSFINLLSVLPLSIATNVCEVYLSTKPVQYHRTKHIELDIHFVREKVALGAVPVLHVPSSSQFADIFTKGLATTLFQDFQTSLHFAAVPEYDMAVSSHSDSFVSAAPLRQ